MHESLQGLLKFGALIVVVVTLLIILRVVTKVPGYVFRKLLHMIAVFAIIPLMQAPSSWVNALLIDGILIVVIVVLLLLAERLSFYKTFFMEKGKHEVVTSFVLLLSMFAFFTLVFWGLLGEEYKYIPIVSVMSWGPGDAMAAIIGITYGKKKLSGKWIEGTKSVEGCVAMALTSILCTSVSLYVLGPYDIGLILSISIVVGVIAMFVELFTKHGLDTISVPIVSSIVLYIASILV